MLLLHNIVSSLLLFLHFYVFMQVCNHPELFERRDVRSPFAMQVDDYHIPKVIAEDGILIRSFPSQRHLLYNRLSTLVPEYIHRANQAVPSWRSRTGVRQSPSCFGFTRFIDMSPTELYRVMVCGWLCA